MFTPDMSYAHDRIVMLQRCTSNGNFLTLTLHDTWMKIGAYQVTEPSELINTSTSALLVKSKLTLKMRQKSKINFSDWHKLYN